VRRPSPSASRHRQVVGAERFRVGPEAHDWPMVDKTYVFETPNFGDAFTYGTTCMSGHARYTSTRSLNRRGWRSVPRF
jgi:hypothetical protein